MLRETERLKKYTEDFQEDLRRDRDRRKLSPNDNMDRDIPDRLASYDFWCGNCQEDFSALAVKSRYRMEGDVIATLRGECPECGEAAIRYATHRDQDPYYQRSVKIRRQRNKFAVDTLQGREYGFRTHYGDPDAEFNKIIAEQEEGIMRADMSTGLRGQSLKAKRKLEEIHRVKGWGQ